MSLEIPNSTLQRGWEAGLFMAERLGKGIALGEEGEREL